MSQPPRPTPPQEKVSIVDAIVPTNPLAAVSCWLGIFSMILCGLGVVLGPIALITGWLGLKKWKMQESAYGAKASTVRAWIGMVTGGLGTLISIAAIVMMVSKS